MHYFIVNASEIVKRKAVVTVKKNRFLTLTKIVICGWLSVIKQ